MQQSRKTKRRRYAIPIAGAFVAFAALGIVTIIYLCFRLTGAVLDNSRERLMFENIIRPVVMFNPPPFEQAADIEMANLLTYSMWAALMSDARNTYEFNENAELVVPASDIDVAAARLFGPDVKLVHQSFGDTYDMLYYYDEKSNVYDVPVGSVFNAYTPQVETVTKKDGFYELSVGFLSSGVSWQTDFSGGEGKPAPDKYMNFIMQKDKDGYFIVKVQDPANILGNMPVPDVLTPAE